MLNILRFTITVGAVGIGCSMASAKGAACVSIENDIARLACFDEAYQQERPSELSPEEAVDALSKLVYIDTPRELLVLTRGSEPCAIRAHYEGLLPYSGRELPYQMVSSVNLSTVERFGKWRGVRDFANGIRGIIAYTGRESTGSWSSKIMRWPIDKGSSRKDVNFYTLPQTESYEGRDAAFFLLVNEYRPDAAKIEEALEAAVLACRPKE
ncbi:hypothetical protein [Sulfitobacter dubius]|uniref:Uncharacterized protein n=1 Tax=Sulfitobacter dubius TaxID=218673 RepID=A0ABY3ZII6_9RHOB|nr:hypothetical protein [Sulfitobacter dubius]UOA14477.1 hypothetical protein DSM109990_01283 [Sulfitobacter dubius]